MSPDRLRQLLEEVRSGQVAVPAALDALRELPFADLGFARVDHHRALRQGLPEVVLGEGKTAEQVVGIVRELVRAGQDVLVTRLAEDVARTLMGAVPQVRYDRVARVARLATQPTLVRSGRPVPVVTAGTSDLPVAEEALATLEACGVPARRVFDVGVAGIHRLFGHLEELRAAPAVIVVAGMEGALASVVGGMVAAPVVAVPTSVGYGVSLGGLTALFGMLSSCAAGITVVNVDNGFGAAMAVFRMVTAMERAAEQP